MPPANKLIRRRCGSIALFIVYAAALSFLVLPVSVHFIQQMNSWVLISRACQSLEQTMPAAQLCLDRQSLAAGELKVDNSQLADFLETRFRDNAPQAVGEKLQYFNTGIAMVPADVNAGHWLEENEGTLYCLEITVTAGINDHRGEPVEIRRGISLIMD